MLNNLNIQITHFGDRAYYSSMNDVITIPKKQRFNSENDYYATLFHEIIHWTGGEKRLGRKSAK